MQLRKDLQTRLVEERLRNAHFLGELTKFRLCPYGTFFTMLKARPVLLHLEACLSQVGFSAGWCGSCRACWMTFRATTLTQR